MYRIQERLKKIVGIQVYYMGKLIINLLYLIIFLHPMNVFIFMITLMVNLMPINQEEEYLMLMIKNYFFLLVILEVDLERRKKIVYLVK